MKTETITVPAEGYIVPAEGYSFFIDSIQMEAELPFLLIDGCTVKKADDEQIDRIKQSVDRFCVGAFSHEYYYEYKIVETESGSAFERQNKENWRYYIIEHEDNSIFDLQFASNITDVPLNFSSLRFKNGGRGYSPSKLQNYFNEANPITKIVRQHDLEDLSHTYKLINHVAGNVKEGSEFPEIRRALQMYDNLKSLPHYSEFHIIGLFAIIEMLVTHNPKLEDRGDSITHQMRAKIPLLSRRFDKEVNTSDFFGDTSENKIWTHLYKYRSLLAHGGMPDFERDLKSLKDFKNVKSFLDLIIRRMLKHSLKEPFLYRDLREC